MGTYIKIPKNTEQEILNLYWKKAPHSYITNKFNIGNHKLKAILNKNGIGKKFNNYRGNQTADDFLITKEGKIFRAYDPSIEVKPFYDKDGYARVSVNQNGYAVHRLVAEKYIENPNNKPHINHKNGIKSDNRVDNLEWVTASENEQHSRKILGKNITGHKKPNSTGIKHRLSIPILDNATGYVYGSISEFCRSKKHNIAGFYRYYPKTRFKKLTKDEYNILNKNNMN